MKKSFLLVLTLPLLLAGCSLFPPEENPSEKPQQETSQTEDQSGTQTGGQTGTETGGESEQGTEGSGTGSTTEGETHSGGHHPGGETTGGGNTGGGTTGGGTETGGGTTEGGTTGGGESQTTTATVSKETTELGLPANNCPTSINLNEDISLGFSIGSNGYNNKPKYYEDESIRLYGGNTLTVQNSKGSIKKIEFSTKSDKKENVFSSDTGSYSSSTTTWTGSASKIVFTVGGTSGHIKLYSLKVTYNTTGGGTTGGGTGEQTGGGTETGGGTGEQTGGGGGTVTTADYTSTWPENFQPYVKTYLNGMLPCYLNVNKKNLFTGYMTGTYELFDDNSNQYLVPYFNPYIKDTSPGINYEYDYGSILRDAGFKFIEDYYDDEINATVHYYQKGQCYVQYNKHLGEDNKYYFDVYAYYDNYYTGSFKNAYNIQYDNKELGLTSSYDSNNKTVKVGNWNLTINNVIKKSESIQFKADTGSIKIQGSLKGLIIEPLLTTNAEALFVKAGTSASNAKYIFNNGGYFEFPSGTTYAEISAKYRVLNIEYFDIIY